MEKDEVQRMMELRLKLTERLQAIISRKDTVQERFYMPNVTTGEFVELWSEYNNLLVEEERIKTDLKVKFRIRKV